MSILDCFTPTLLMLMHQLILTHPIILKMASLTVFMLDLPKDCQYILVIISIRYKQYNLYVVLLVKANCCIR